MKNKLCFISNVPEKAQYIFPQPSLNEDRQAREKYIWIKPRLKALIREDILENLLTASSSPSDEGVCTSANSAMIAAQEVQIVAD